MAASEGQLGQGGQLQQEEDEDGEANNDKEN
jgi:hypothetical protein